VIVMPANNTHYLVHYWAGLYGGLGHLVGPDRSYNAMPHLPYALDNGAFGAWTAKRAWNELAFVKHVAAHCHSLLRPMWCVVPDVVGDREATLAMWSEWAPRLRDQHHLALAFAVQDGMTPNDVPHGADIVFVGGTTAWKWDTLEMWARAWPRVHVGRVNGRKGLDLCAGAGVESCDGTGWFRGDPAQLIELGTFLAEQAGKPFDRLIVTGSRSKGREQRCLPV